MPQALLRWGTMSNLLLLLLLCLLGVPRQTVSGGEEIGDVGGYFGLVWHFQGKARQLHACYFWHGM